MQQTTKQPYEISIRQLFRIVTPQVVGGGRVLAIWLEEFLGDIRNYVSLSGKALLKAAAVLQGSLPIADLFLAAEKTQGTPQGRAPPTLQRGKGSVLSRFLTGLTKG